MNAKVYSTEGQPVREIELAEEVFGCEVSRGSIYYAIRNELANRRLGTASTKTRAEVQGSGAKPWAQKGTGHARAGHKRSPLWVGGGIIFGPRPRDYSYTTPKKIKRLAMKSILSMKVGEERLKVVEDFTVESGKTRDLRSILLKLGQEERSVLVLGGEDRMVRRAGRNLPWLTVLAHDRLCAHDLYYGRSVLVLESAARKLGELYSVKAGEGNHAGR